MVNINENRSQGSCILKTRLNFTRNLPLVVKRDYFLPNVFTILKLEGHFMVIVLLLVEESYEKSGECHYSVGTLIRHPRRGPS